MFLKIQTAISNLTHLRFDLRSNLVYSLQSKLKSQLKTKKTNRLREKLKAKLKAKFKNEIDLEAKPWLVAHKQVSVTKKNQNLPNSPYLGGGLPKAGRGYFFTTNSNSNSTQNPINKPKNKTNKQIPMFKTFSSLFSFLALASLLLTINPINTRAATYDISPSTRTFLVGPGCSQSVDIMADATNQSSNAADAEINFNPSEITVNSVQPGNAYSSYVFNKVDIVNATTGKIKLAAVTIDSSAWLTSKKKFATINFTPKANITTTSFSIRLDGVGTSFTFDSNIADSATSLDILTSVAGGTYTFTPGICETTPPVITYTNPLPNARKVALDTNINIKITDNLSGVDLNTVQFTIDNKNYKPGDTQVSYTGNPLEYNFVINPDNNFPTDYTVNLNTTAKDLLGNTSSKATEFSTIYVCTNTPDTNVTNVTNVTNTTTTTNPTTTESNNPLYNVIQKITQNQVTQTSPNQSNQQPQQQAKTGIVTQIQTLNQEVIKYMDLSILLFVVFLPLVILLLLLELIKRPVRGILKDTNASTENTIETTNINTNNNTTNTNKLNTPSPYANYLINAVEIATGKVVAKTTTNQEGKYTLWLNPGFYQIQVAKRTSKPQQEAAQFRVHLDWAKEVLVTRFQNNQVIDETTSNPVNLNSQTIINNLAKNSVEILSQQTNNANATNTINTINTINTNTAKTIQSIQTNNTNNTNTQNSETNQPVYSTNQLYEILITTFYWLLAILKSHTVGIITATLILSIFNYTIYPNLANLITLVIIVLIFIARVIFPAIWDMYLYLKSRQTNRPGTTRKTTEEKNNQNQSDKDTEAKTNQNVKPTKPVKPAKSTKPTTRAKHTTQQEEEIVERDY